MVAATSPVACTRPLTRCLLHKCSYETESEPEDRFDADFNESVSSWFPCGSDCRREADRGHTVYRPLIAADLLAAATSNTLPATPLPLMRPAVIAGGRGG